MSRAFRYVTFARCRNGDEIPLKTDHVESANNTRAVFSDNKQRSICGLHTARRQATEDKDVCQILRVLLRFGFCGLLSQYISRIADSH